MLCIEEGRYRYTVHGLNRKLERQVTEQDALYVLENGYRIQKRDVYSELNKSWTYAFEGTTLQDELLRVIIAFDAENMLIVTVIPISKRS